MWQVASSTKETALRASGVDGVMACLSSQQRRKNTLQIGTAASRFLVGWSTEANCMADRAYGAVTTRTGLSVSRDHQARALCQLQQVLGRTVGCVWIVLPEPRCSNRPLRRLDVKLTTKILESLRQEQ